MLTTVLPKGDEIDNYQLYIFIQIIDDSSGISRFMINETVTVLPDENIKNNLVDQLVSQSVTSDFFNSLKSGSLKDTSTNVLALTSLLNVASNSSNNTVN